MIISSKTISFVLLLTLFFLFSQTLLSDANDTIDTTQALTENQTLVSSGERFELGFFRPGNSKNWYIGIWYKNVTVVTPVWVANRENPVRDITTAAFKVIKPGLIAIVNGSNDIIWSSNTTSKNAQNPIAQLLNNGNLVLRDADDPPENYIWQSFDYATDTRIPGMKLGWDFVSGIEHYFTSWKSSDDPAPGEYRSHLDVSGRPQVFILKGKAPVYRIGPWNGAFYSGMINMNKDSSFTYSMNISKNGVYTMEQLDDQSLITRFTLNPNGESMRGVWVQETQSWAFSMSIPTDNCDHYKICGAHGICNIGSAPVCSCLDKFVPQDPQGWARLDWSKGCVRRTAFNCAGDSGFIKYRNIKLPDARNSWYNESMTLKECEEECLKKCNCTAYTNLDIRGSGCLLWFGELVDSRALSTEGQDIYIRMASSELGSNVSRTKIVAVILSATGSSLLVLLVLIICLWKRKIGSGSNDGNRGRIKDEAHNKDLELPLFDLRTVLKATSNFSDQNKLGEGGYGPVYKGKMEDGEDVAVKRLSMTSLQGFDELKNEVFCIAKLQHRNLVKLLGYCIQGEEKMLIYEYMPNKSLDLILFADESKRKLLDWRKRFHIVSGIARGLLYLHQDSRLRIIHRDLKASNVLLDEDMNPKISDFGLARIFKGNESAHKTNRVVGTYGYMPPEYAVHGRFSTKSDVFSFGVLLLEIVSGKRNSSFEYENGYINLLGHAWTLFKEGRSMDLVDGCLSTDAISTFILLRLIQVGLLCVQLHADDRPTMSSVVAMIDNEIALPEPTQPAFHADRVVLNSTRKDKISSTNQVTVTILEPR